MAKKSQTFELFGKFRYFKGFPQNKDTRGPEGADWASHGGMYITDFIMDEENMKKFKSSKSQWKLYDRNYINEAGDKPFKDVLGDDEYLIRPRRKHEAKYAQYGGAPAVVLANGQPIDPTEGMGVGNDSEGFVVFSVYTAPGNYRGSRWEGAQITKWLQYPIGSGEGIHFENRGETAISMSPDAEVDAEDVGQTTKASKAKAREAVDDLEDDEIPL